MPAAPTANVLTAEPGSTNQHFAFDVAFPVYSVQFAQDHLVVLAGGGGSSRTGVKNRLSMYRILPTAKQLALVTEHELSKQEDAPMTIAIHRPSKTIAAGINSDLETLKQGTNHNLRMFRYDQDDLLDHSPDSPPQLPLDNLITFEQRKQTLKSLDPDHYQKVTTFSRPRNPLTAPLLALGSTASQLSLVSLPNLNDVMSKGPLSRENDTTRQYEGEEVFDVDFNDQGDMLVGTSSTKLCVWSTTPNDLARTKDKREPEEDDEEPLQVIERPVLKKELACTFRAAKFGRQGTASNLYTVVNATPSSTGGGGGGKKRKRSDANKNKKSFVSLWDTNLWKLNKTRTVGMKPITSFDVSEDGTLLAYGSSDLSIGILDATTLRPIMTILKAHDFPSTCLKFNPNGTLLVSGSADNSFRVIVVPGVDQRGGESKMTIVWITVFVLLLAILVQQGYITPETWRIARGIMN
ncbi:WD40 repeat domain-containing protein [Sporobolomyces koalae]|uniref:WD40 repeat domain-containing protein n=1 Tax=Sporobolomyces koalae TaxID=500713 RepID=UPI00316EFD51